MKILKKLADLENEASAFGFKWETANQIFAQIQSEVFEVEVHLKDGDRQKLQEEIGDLLHAVFSLCVFCRFELEETLLNSIIKFERRFKMIKKIAKENDLETLHGQSFDELMLLWDKAKLLTEVDNIILEEAPIVLTGKYVQLEPLQKIHYEILEELSRDNKISIYSPGLRFKFDAWFNKALSQTHKNSQLTFIVRTLHDKKVVGSTRFYEIDKNHRHLAIGYTWLIPQVWGTGVNTECKLLLLKYAFETLLMNRVVFYIDARNERSQAAVKKIGATKEGVLREHIILEDGYVRDTVVYSILKNEWENKPIANKMDFNLL